MSTAKDLPSELLDLIILHVLTLEDGYSHEAIRALSLVSKSWRAVCLRHLFTNASFGDDDDFTRWHEILIALPQVANYVRSAMYMYFPIPPTPPGDLAYGTFYDIPTMPAVDKLTWFMPNLDRSPGSGADRFLCSFPGVTQLRIMNVEDVNDSRWVLSHFPKLQSLQWENCSFPFAESNSTHAEFPSPYRLDLSHLKVLEATESEGGWLDWLVDDIFAASPSGSPLRLRKIEIDSHLLKGCALSTGSLARLLVGVAGTLEEMSFLVTNLKAQVFLPAEAAKIVLHRLESTTFSLSDCSGLDVDNLVLFRWICSAIKHFPIAPQLKELKFRVDVDMKAEDSTNNVDVQSDGSFSDDVCHRFPALEVITLEVPGLDLQDVGALMNRVQSRRGALASKIVFVVDYESTARIHADLMLYDADSRGGIGCGHW